MFHKCQFEQDGKQTQNSQEGEARMTSLTTSTTADWESHLNSLLPVYGHRNWIVVTDAAFPVQSKTGIETIVSAAGQVEVVRKVMGAIKAAKHIRANAYTDGELAFIPESDAPGVTEYLRQLDALIDGPWEKNIPHQKIMDRINEAAQTYNVMVIKTDMLIPYTSVFFELDCGYWTAEAEGRLQQAMKSREARESK
jgi:hypothetical protein